jgi:Ca2+/Na+ antiporter
MLGVAALLLPMMIHKRMIHKWKGAILLAIYIAYIVSIAF